MLYERCVVQNHSIGNMNNSDDEDCCDCWIGVFGRRQSKNDKETPTKQELQKLQLENASLKREKDDALTRLSEVMSLKLRDNNPNIADLSDQFRPTKLQEMFSELYDNEWTSAFTVLQDQLSERSAVEFLLDVVLLSYEFCSYELKKTWEVVCTWYIDEDRNTQLPKQLKDSRKAKVPRLVDEVAREFASYISKVCINDKIRGTLSGPFVKSYISNSLKIALLMCACDPPVVIGCPGLEGRPAYSSHTNEVLCMTEIEKRLNITEQSEAGHVDNLRSQKVNVLVHSSDDRSSQEQPGGSGNKDDKVVDCNNDKLEIKSETQTTSTDENPTIKTGHDSKSGDRSDVETKISSIVNKETVRINHSGFMNNANEGLYCPADLYNQDTAHEITSMNCQNSKDGSSTVKSKTIVSQPSNSGVNIAFEKNIYREYTSSGPRVEFFVWPVVFLHEEGPILAKGVAQGTKLGLATDTNKMWSWRTCEPETNASFGDTETREQGTKALIWETKTRDSETKASIGETEAHVPETKASIVDTTTCEPHKKASTGDIGIRVLPETKASTGGIGILVSETKNSAGDTGTSESETKVSAGDIGTRESKTQDLLDGKGIINTKL